MQNSRTTAGETAPRTLVIFRDCHVKNNIVVELVSSYEERFYRNFARRMGWPCTIRKRTAQAEAQPAAPAAVHNWRKPAAGFNRPRLGGAFQLTVTPYRMEGGAA